MLSTLTTGEVGRDRGEDTPVRKRPASCRATASVRNAFAIFPAIWERIDGSLSNAGKAFPV